MCVQVFKASPMPSPPGPWTATPPTSRPQMGRQQLQHNSCSGGGHQPLGLGLTDSASVLFLAHPGQIRMGSELSSRGKGLFGRLPIHSFPRSWGPGTSRGKAKGAAEWCAGEGWRAASSHQAAGSPQKIENSQVPWEWGVISPRAGSGAACRSEASRQLSVHQWKLQRQAV